jgi:hypothetical protein
LALRDFLEETQLVKVALDNVLFSTSSSAPQI